MTFGLIHINAIKGFALVKVQYIFNWFTKKISSAISEGSNNKIKRLKRMDYGYRDIDYFRLKIYQQSFVFLHFLHFLHVKNKSNAYRTYHPNLNHPHTYFI